jgi:hypothetical protein
VVYKQRKLVFQSGSLEIQRQVLALVMSGLGSFCSTWVEVTELVRCLHSSSIAPKAYGLG